MKMNDENEIGLIPLLKALLTTCVEFLVGFIIIMIAIVFAGFLTYLFNLFFDFIL